MNDKKHGHGKYTWPDGRIFEGEWVLGKREGKGKQVSKNGQIRQGVWHNDKRENWAGEDSRPDTEQPAIQIQINNVPISQQSRGKRGGYKIFK